MIALTHHVDIILDIDIHVGVTNIHAVIHPFETCHVLDVEIHNIYLKIDILLHC